MKIELFTRWIFIISESRVFSSGIKMGVNIVCTSLLTGNTMEAFVKLRNAK